MVRCGGQGLLPGCKEASRRADRKAADYEAARLRCLSSRPSGGTGSRAAWLTKRDTPEKNQQEMLQSQVG